MSSADDLSSDFEAAFAHSLDGVMITGTDGSIYAANPAACRLLGRDEGEILGLGRSSVVDPSDPEVRRALEIRQQTGSFQGEMTFVHKDGRRFPVEVSTVLFDHGQGRQRTVMIFRDITERRRVSELLRASEDKFARVFHSSPDGITVTRRADGKYLEVNPGFTLLSGYQMDEVIGRTPLELGIWVSAEERAQFVHELEHNGQVLNHEYVFRFKGGKLCTTLVSARFLEIAGVPCILSTTRDITERKRLEESLVQTQRLESIGLLAGGIAHDFNNMLAGLLGFLELAQAMEQQGNHAKVETYLAKALAIYPRARSLTRQLLTFAKGGEPVRTIVSVGNILKTSTLFALSGSNLLAEFDLAGDLWPCDCDEAQIGQVVDNLVLNAAQAMPQGGTLLVAASNVSGPSGHGPFVKISITDHGPGIDPALLPKIFDPFVTTKTTGNGLGLATVSSILRRHGGWVEVDSVLGEGTTFHFFLPASRQADRLLNPPEPATEHRGQGKFLVLDDDPYVLEVTTQWLETMGYRVTGCRTDTEAYQAFLQARSQATPFQAALLDLTIPGSQGGIELARRLTSEDPTLVLIATTGYSENPVIAHPGDFGFHGKLVKPYQRHDLAKVLTALTATPPSRI